MGEKTWYHGSPLALDILHAGSTITDDRHLAEVFSSKPALVSLDDEGRIRHNGTLPGYLYTVKEVGSEDVYPHPRSSMPGKEWLTRRDLRLTLIGPVVPLPEEQLSPDEVEKLRRRAPAETRGETLRPSHPAVTIQLAGPEDAAEILALQKLAYRSEAEIYDDWTIAPLHQTLEEMQKDLQTLTVLKVVRDGCIVGSVRVRVEGGTGLIGRLIVHPDCQNQGIGTQMLLQAERLSPGVERFELFTGHRSARNLHLYQKLGYREFRRDQVNDVLTLIYLEKRMH